MKELNINGYKEQIVERSDYPIEQCKEILNNKITAILGYGPQGRGQGLNMRDQGFNVIIGLRKGPSWEKALEDGWVENENLFEINEATKKGDIIQFLLSDAGQIQAWPDVKKNLSEGDTLYFSHGFGVVFHADTNIIPPKDINVVLVAPKGSGLTVRNHFLEGRGINSSYAIYQDYDGSAKQIAIATAFAIGSGHLFETTFEKEVHSDLTGERCVLMGLIQGAFLAQYEVLREKGHSPSEAYNETIEEALESLYPLVSEKGMDWMYSNCSTTAQRGALDWAPKFKNVLKPVINECYEKVVSGEEARISISSNSRSDYREQLDKELEEVNNQEMWLAGKQLRPLRPENLH
jgi:ketol-acid reductoisomerase